VPVRRQRGVPVKRERKGGKQGGVTWARTESTESPDAVKMREWHKNQIAKTKKQSQKGKVVKDERGKKKKEKKNRKKAKTNYTFSNL